MFKIITFCSIKYFQKSLIDCLTSTLYKYLAYDVYLKTRITQYEFQFEWFLEGGSVVDLHACMTKAEALNCIPQQPTFLKLSFLHRAQVQNILEKFGGAFLDI